jgi:hypothetical protein
MKAWTERGVEWLRRLLMGDLREVVVRLQQELEDQRHALCDPSTIRPLVVAALQEEVRQAPADMAAVLAPIADRLLSNHEMVVRRDMSRPPAPPHLGNRWLLGATAVVIAALAMPRVAGTSKAALEAPAVATAPAPVIIEERNEGFGLAQADLTDEGFTQQVRAQLSACSELANARVSFSVKDGWVWLRGSASAEGREAAERALRSIGHGIFVINQLTADVHENAVAER